MPPRSKGKRDIDETVGQTAAHAVADLPAPPPIVITQVRPAEPQLTTPPTPAEQPANGHIPQPSAPPASESSPVTVDQAPPVRTEVRAPAKTPVKEMPAPEPPKKPDTAVDRPDDTPAPGRTADVPAAPDEPHRPPAQERPKPVAGRAAAPTGRRVRPTSNAECKGDPRRKHTINLAPVAYKRLGELQLAETLRAGREQPLWPHVDAALAVLRRDECSDADLLDWAGRAEQFADLLGDDYRQVGILLRKSVLEAVRTLRVRLRSVGADDVDVQAVLSAAIIAYLDELEAQAEA